MPLVATEETFTITPVLLPSIAGSTARQHHNVGNNERRTSASIWAGVVLSERFCPDRAADIIDQNVDAAETSDGCFDRHAGAVKCFEIGDDRDAAFGFAFNLVHQVRAVEQRDLRALGCKAQGHGAAYALSGAGHDSDFPGEPSWTGGGHAAFPLLFQMWYISTT